MTVAFANGGSALVSYGSDEVVRLHELTRLGLTGHHGPVRATSVAGRSHTGTAEVATAGDDGTARLWRVTDLGSIAADAVITEHAAGVSALAWRPGGHVLATGGHDQTLQFWNSDGSATTPLAKVNTDVTSMAYSPTGRLLATGSSIAKLWDVANPASPRLLATMTGHSNTVTSEAFTPDGQTLITTSTDHTVRLWDITRPSAPRAVAVLTAHTDAVNAAAVSSDGHWLATGSDDQTIRLWDLTTKPQATMTATLTGHTAAVTTIAFNHEGTMLASGSADHTIRLWPVLPHGVDQSNATILNGHTDTVWAVTFGLSSDRLVSVGGDTPTPRIWETDPERIAATICGSTTPAITREQWSRYLPAMPYQPPCT